jgi:hypothetical protein
MTPNPNPHGTGAELKKNFVPDFCRGKVGIHYISFFLSFLGSVYYRLFSDLLLSRVYESKTAWVKRPSPRPFLAQSFVKRLGEKPFLLGEQKALGETPVSARVFISILLFAGCNRKHMIRPDRF